MEKDYSEKILEGKSLNEIVNYVNNLVERDFSLIEEYDGMSKWNFLPMLLIEPEEKTNRVLKFMEYVDEMLISEKEKILYLITISSLVEHGKIQMDAMEDAQVTVLTDFFMDKTVEEIGSLLPIVNFEVLISEVRKKTLDRDSRTAILDTVVEEYKKRNPSDINVFIMQMVDKIHNTDYYDLIKTN